PTCLTTICFLLTLRPQPRSTLFPYTTLFRSRDLRLREMFCHLKYVARSNNLQVFEGDCYLEIKGPGIDKSSAAMDFIGKERFDFILAIGDQWTNEESFKALPSSAFSICVGHKCSRAQFNVNSHHEVKQILEQLGEVESLQIMMI